jgi:sec-independent protein translocase protein TatA
MDIGVPELLIVLVAVLLLFGGKKLPELARSLGKAQNEFKKGLSDGESDGKSVAKPVDSKPADAPTASPAVPVAPIVAAKDDPAS